MKIVKVAGGVAVPDNIAKRHGKFTVDSHLIADNYEEALRVMRGIVVLRAEHDIATLTIEYTALAPFFDVVEIGMVIPTYTPVIHMKTGKGIIKVVWKRVDK